MGAEGVKLPALSQPTLGKKQVGDLISNDVKLHISGTTVKPTGTVKNIAEPWPDFDKAGSNTGHFFPMTLPAACKQQKVTCKGREAGDRTVTIDEDLMLITRLENLSADVLTLEMGGQLLMTVDFTDITKAGV